MGGIGEDVMRRLLMPPIITLMLSSILVATTSEKKHSSQPQLTIVIVIDQFSAHQLKKVTPFLSGGIKRMLEQGTVYTNARHPHGFPTTATGHAALNTGAFGKDHGITLNAWRNDNGKTHCFSDDRDCSLIFRGNHFHNHGASAANLMTEGLSDQFVKASRPDAPHQAIALSHKCRAAIGLSGKQGKPIWLDPESLQFTSSKAFFDKLPGWVDEINKQYHIKHNAWVDWRLRFPKDHPAYQSPLLNNYTWSSSPTPLAGTTVQNHVPHKKQNKIKRDGLPRSSNFAISPASNQLLLNVATRCLEQTMVSPNQHLLLWVSLSPLDRIGHSFGPYSYEALDMIYHLDLQLEQFIHEVIKKYAVYKPLFALTADHGVLPIPEKLPSLGLPQGKRINSSELIHKLNEIAQRNYGIKKAVKEFISNHFFLNQKKIRKLSLNQREKLLNNFKKIIGSTQGIKQVWTSQELALGSFSPLSPEYCMQQQLYPGRVGDLICLPQPWATLSKGNSGATHKSPYPIDTHVPLILYDAINPIKKEISSSVFIPQLTVTLSRILNVAPPPKAAFGELP